MTVHQKQTLCGERVSSVDLQLGFERHKSFLCVLPPFIAFGLTVTIHMPLAFGVKVALCVSPNPAQIGEFVEKYHPDYIICGTAQAENMVIALENKKIDLSNLAFFGVGGDALSLALENRVNDFLKKHHRLFADFRQTVFLYPHIKKGGHALWQNRKPSSS